MVENVEDAVSYSHDPMNRNPVPADNQESTSETSEGKILFWLIVFLPLGLYFLAKEKKLHIWFSYVLIFFGIIYFIPVLVQIFFVYPRLSQLYSDFAVPLENTNFKLYALGIILFLVFEILFGVFLRSKVKKEGFLNNYFIIPAILLLFSQNLMAGLFIRNAVLQSIMPIYNLTSSLDPYSAPTPISSPTIAPTPNSLSETTKIYTDEVVYFKYPANWIAESIVISGSGNSKEFKDESRGIIFSLSVRGNYNQLTGKPYENFEEYMNIVLKEPVKKPVFIIGKEAAEIYPRAGSENINSVVFFSYDNSKIITLTLQTGENSQSVRETQVDEGRELFEQILASFRFRAGKYILGEVKSATATVKSGSWYGPPHDPELYELDIDPGSNLFAKSELVDLRSYLNKEIMLTYREAEGAIMSEQQLVIVESVDD